MQIGVSTAAFYGRMETEDAAAHVAALGIPLCEVFLETYSEYTPSFGALVRERLGNTRAVSVHAKTQHFESDLFGASIRQREDAFALLRRFLQAGAVLGARVYVYHGPACIRGGTPRLDRWQKSIERAIAMAADYGIDFAWETVSWCHLNSPERVHAFRACWPQLHYVLDIKQVHELGHQPQPYIDAMGDRLRHVHVHDHDAEGNLRLPGQGVVDFRALARALRRAGYTGNVIVEPYASDVPSDRALLESIDWLQGMFGE